MAKDAVELKFPVEVPEQGKKYGYEQKLRVLRRESNGMHERRERVTRASLAEKAQPYLKEMKAKSIESFICILFTDHRKDYDSLRISETRQGEWEEAPLPEGHPPIMFEDVTRTAGTTSAATRSARKDGPFSMSARLAEEIDKLRARHPAARDPASRRRSLDVEPEGSLADVYRRNP